MKWPKLVDFWEFSMIFVDLAAAFSVEVEYWRG